MGSSRARTHREDRLFRRSWTLLLVPFGIAVAATVFAMNGADAPRAFETIFFDASAATPMGPAALLAISLIAVANVMLSAPGIVFPVLQPAGAVGTG
jgi:hypothetical protein